MSHSLIQFLGGNYNLDKNDAQNTDLHNKRTRTAPSYTKITMIMMPLVAKDKLFFFLQEKVWAFHQHKKKWP